MCSTAAGDGGRQGGGRRDEPWGCVERQRAKLWRWIGNSPHQTIARVRLPRITHRESRDTRSRRPVTRQTWPPPAFCRDTGYRRNDSLSLRAVSHIPRPLTSSLPLSLRCESPLTEIVGARYEPQLLNEGDGDATFELREHFGLEVQHRDRGDDESPLLTAPIAVHLNEVVSEEYLLLGVSRKTGERRRIFGVRPEAVEGFAQGRIRGRPQMVARREPGAFRRRHVVSALCNAAPPWERRRS